jgi:3-phenylpropionate/trans-cinnamate dioxygenase ferredoxin reductase subunit
MRVVLVGAGLAAQRCCETLRTLGHDGPITMVGAEPHPPYDRPPLSKALLAGKRPPLALRPAGWHAEHGVRLWLGAAATALDVRARRVTLATGETLPYDRLLIATGARPAAPGGLPTLRTLEDAVALDGALRPGRRLAVLGAGLIGQEIASAAVARGVHVTLIDAAPAPFDALLGPGLGHHLARLHERAGVRLLLGTGVFNFGHGPTPPHPASPNLKGTVPCKLAVEGGEVVECELALAAVGVRPDTAWTGLWPRGVPADPGVDGVYAAGDATGAGHWEAAARQGAAAARAMLGRPPRAEAPPLVWSDQHGIRFQRLGDPSGADRHVLDGDPAAGDFEATFFRAGRPVAVVLAGRPGAVPAARRRLSPPIQEAA